jgi:hypothetical protein
LLYRIGVKKVLVGQVLLCKILLVILHRLTQALPLDQAYAAVEGLETPEGRSYLEMEVNRQHLDSYLSTVQALVT